jgi:hypothetical protein
VGSQNKHIAVHSTDQYDQLQAIWGESSKYADPDSTTVRWNVALYLRIAAQMSVHVHYPRGAGAIFYASPARGRALESLILNRLQQLVRKYRASCKTNEQSACPSLIKSRRCHIYGPNTLIPYYRYCFLAVDLYPRRVSSAWTPLPESFLAPTYARSCRNVICSSLCSIYASL